MVIRTGRSPGSTSLGSFPSPYPFGLSMCSTYAVHELPGSENFRETLDPHWEVNAEPFSCDFKLVRSVPMGLRDRERWCLEIKRKAGTMNPKTTTMVMMLCRTFALGCFISKHAEGVSPATAPSSA